MRRLKILSFFLFAIFSSLSTSLFAQDFFNFTSKPAQPTEQAKTTSQPMKVLSPQDFKSTVSTLGQQTKNSLAEELNAQIAKRPPIPVQEPAPIPTTSSGSQSGTAKSQPPIPQSPAEETAPAQTQASQQQAAPNVPPEVETQPPTQIYSGFQGTQQKNNQQQSGQSSGGWGIKY